MKLSKNFELSEFLFSSTAVRHDIKEQLMPPESVKINLKLLCENILQPVRDRFGAIKITSGYRCRRLNDLVKGSATSQHVTGMAADIQGIKATNKALFDFIKSSGIEYDQLIWEYGTQKEPAWIHVSFNPGKNRKQILYIGVI